jgi:hypothetical protein
MILLQSVSDSALDARTALQKDENGLVLRQWK